MYLSTYPFRSSSSAPLSSSFIKTTSQGRFASTFSSTAVSLPISSIITYRSGSVYSVLRSNRCSASRWGCQVDWRSPVNLRAQIRAASPVLERSQRKIATMGMNMMGWDFAAWFWIELQLWLVLSLVLSLNRRFCRFVDCFCSANSTPLLYRVDACYMIFIVTRGVIVTVYSYFCSNTVFFSCVIPWIPIRIENIFILFLTELVKSLCLWIHKKISYATKWYWNKIDFRKHSGWLSFVNYCYIGINNNESYFSSKFLIN